MQPPGAGDRELGCIRGGPDLLAFLLPLLPLPFFLTSVFFLAFSLLLPSSSFNSLTSFISFTSFTFGRVRINRVNRCSICYCFFFLKHAKYEFLYTFRMRVAKKRGSLRRAKLACSRRSFIFDEEQLLNKKHAKCKFLYTIRMRGPKKRGSPRRAKLACSR